MKHRSLFVILAILCAGLALGQAAAPPGHTAQGVRIIAPKVGDKLSQSSVTVQYEAEDPGPASPSFSVQLDGREPVLTTETTQNFTGLTPGAHTVVVQLVDPDKTPIADSRAEAQFNTISPAAQTQPAHAATADLRSALPQSDAISDQGEPLPAASSPLPLLSVIGFGALVGGVLSALKTR